jgi:hypothetical protein
MALNAPSMHIQGSISVYVGQEVVVFRKYMDREAEVSDKGLTWIRIMRRERVIIEFLSPVPAGSGCRSDL